ncbi:TPA: aldo/keto reductase [Staphylococcus aureus]
MKYITLNNNLKMPMLGYGTYQIENLEKCEHSVLDALNNGYRLIDTAASYMNEEAVGNAIKKSGIKRSDIFLTSKVWIQDHGYESTIAAFERSLEKLQTDYLDLYLIHQAYGDIYGTWRAMEDLYKAGKTRAIGVCNFNQRQILDLSAFNEIKPMINQIEHNPFFQNEIMYQTLQDEDIQMEAWGPFAEGHNDIFNNSTLKTIADKYNKTTGQVILRWTIQKGIITIPKSVREERIKENFDIWDFELSVEDMNVIQTLDEGKSSIIDFDNPEIIKFLSSMKIHD